MPSEPVTASIPIVAIVQKLTDSVRQQLNLVPDLDGYFEKPFDPDQLAEFVATRLQRSHEGPRAARRDRLTGLLARRSPPGAAGRRRAGAAELLFGAVSGIASVRAGLDGSPRRDPRTPATAQALVALVRAYEDRSGA